MIGSSLPSLTMIEVRRGNRGSIRFVNCAFWGPCRQIAKIVGSGTVGFGDCTFELWDRDQHGVPAIEAEEERSSCAVASSAKTIHRFCSVQVFVGPSWRRTSSEERRVSRTSAVEMSRSV
jgi:hypothetical protein